MMQFQIWLREMWLKHIDEYLDWYKTMPAYGMEEYFTRYQQWLEEQYNKGADDNDGTSSETSTEE